MKSSIFIFDLNKRKVFKSFLKLNEDINLSPLFSFHKFDHVTISFLIIHLLELPLPDPGGHILLSLSSCPSPGPQAPKPPHRQQGCY